MKREELASLWDGLKRVLGAAADLMIINLLLILFCLPVITLGAAWTAGYACLLRVVRGEEQGFPFRPFFEEFCKNFRRATSAWLLLLLALAILAGDYYYAVYVSIPPSRLFLIFSIAMAVVLFAAAVWLFPLMARFENKVRTHIKNAFLMAAAVFPRTLAAMAVQLLCLTLPLLLPEVFFYLGWFWVLFGFSLPMYCTAYLFRKPLESTPEKARENRQD
jgi:uncharacterized membrane protein YesL